MDLRHIFAFSSFCFGALSASACTYSLDLDRFHQAAAGTTSSAGGSVTYSDLDFIAKSMRPHIGEYFEVRIVDKSNLLQAKAIYNNVINEDFELYLAKIVPKVNAPYRIDYWADHNQSGGYDGIVGGINSKDHAWRRVLSDPLPEDIVLANGIYTFTFQHDTNFVDIATDLDGNPISLAETLLPCNVSISGADAYAGKMIEIRVSDHAADRLVGFYRIGAATSTFAATITGVLDEETAYDVTAFADTDGNGKYDAGTDPSWSAQGTSSSDGLTVAMDLVSLAQTAIQTGQP